MNTPKNPHNDKNLELARRIDLLNRHAASSHSVEIDDPLFDLLSEYKIQREETAKRVSGTPSEMWTAINKELGDTQAEKKKKIYSLSFDNRAVWATAASIMVIILAGIIYFSIQTQPYLLASTQQKIESVTLSDGSTVMLRPYSKLFSLDADTDEQKYRLSGEAYFEVQYNPGRTFIVEAGNGLIEVLGTAFNLSSWGKQTQVYLAEGSINFQSVETGASAILEPGQSAAIDSSLNLETVKQATEEEFTDWMNKEITFNNRPAEYVFNELEQEFDIEISAPDSIYSVSLSGSLSLENRDRSFDYLEKVLGGSFQFGSEHTVRFVPIK